MRFIMARNSAQAAPGRPVPCPAFLRQASTQPYGSGSLWHSICTRREDAMKSATIGVTLAMLAASGAAQGGDCLDAKAAKAGFVLERPGIRSEFRPVAGGMVSIANTYASQSPQTQYFYA